MKIASNALALTLLLGIRPAVAQTPETRTWLGAGVGVAAPVEVNLAQAVSLNLSHQRGGHVFSLRAAAAFEILGGTDYTDVGLLYGRAMSSGPVFAAAGAGLGIVFGRRGGGFNIWGGGTSPAESIGPVIGMPLEAQLSVRLLPFLGIGVYGFANVNSERTLLGGTVGVRLGAL